MLTILTSDPSDKSARHKAGDSTTAATRPTRPTGPPTAAGDTLTTRMVTPPRRSASRSTSARCTASERESGMRSPGSSARSARSADRSRPRGAHAIRHEHPRRAGTVAAQAPDAGGRGDPPVGTRSLRPSTAGSAAPTWSTARTTSCRRRRCPRVVSVYDCWFLEHPRDVDADVRRAAAVLRRSVAEGATTSSRRRSATTVRVRELLATDQVHTIHLGPPPVPTIPPDDRPASLPDLEERPVHPGARHRRASQEHPDARRRVRSSGREHEHVELVIAGNPGNDVPARRSRDQSTRSTDAADRVRPARPGDRRREDLAARLRTDARVPVARRRVRLPDPRGPTARHAGRGQHGRIDSRDHRSRGAAQRTARLRGPGGQPVLGREQRRHARQAGPPRPHQPAPVHLGGHRGSPDRAVQTLLDEPVRSVRVDPSGEWHVIDRRRHRRHHGRVRRRRCGPLPARADRRRRRPRRRSRPSSTPATTA